VEAWRRGGVAARGEGGPAEAEYRSGEEFTKGRGLGEAVADSIGRHRESRKVAPSV